ncbi:DUF4091 domain-containing protein [Flagellimonas onchidii]|uniref:DUF4091 domain-containing protein n=1 Tax=Flagellimonas onchidii TaxID=2562684 RepID=UPI001456167D|nr:DUF4091 domain-containing protein [Allomuricauda onchidii]
MKTRILFSLAILSLFACKEQAPNVQFAYVDSLEKILPEATYFKDATAHTDVARGEHASFQFAVRANADISNLKVTVTAPEKDGTTLSDIKKGFVGYVKVGRTNPEPSKDILRSPSGYFPDPILYQDTKNVPFGTPQPIWLTVKIPTDAPTGTYKGEVQISGQANGVSFTDTKPISIEVFKPIIDKTSLWVTNWFFLDRLSYLNDNQPVEAYSDTYWKLARVMAKTLAEYRQNMALLSPLDHTEFTEENGTWKFDFTNFNKLVNLFKEEGVIGRLEGGHFGNRIDGSWSGDFGLKVPIIEKDTTYLKTKALSDPKTRNFYDQFLPALMDNIKNNGWAENYVQHIADEPIDDNVDSYIEISNYIKSILPNVKIIEACHTSKLEGKIDIWVPQMNFLNEDLDFYKEQQEQGDEAWYYTCLAPKGEYANRFVEQPLIKTRLLHWVNHKYGIPGYLHWGFNYWSSKGGITVSGDPYSDASGLIGSSGNVLPGGDCWISYPAKDEIYPSIRLEAMRDGIVDYELLKMYAEKYPEKAKDMVGITVYNFEHYDTNIGDFRKKRRKMLEALSK